MLSNTIESIQRENAKFARDVEYVKEITKDDMIDDRVFAAESAVLLHNDSHKEMKEAAEYVNALSSEDDVIKENAEVERILNADHDLTFEEMAGID